MKKIVSIMCIIILLVATSNLAVKIHFCGGEISSINFFGENKSCGNTTCDSKASSLKEKSCCKTFSATITTDDSTTSTFSFQTQQQAAAIIPAVFLSVQVPRFTTEILKGSVACHAAYTLPAQPFYILYRSLII